MKHIEDIAFIVQARLASERLPRKMLLPFAGTTLVDIALAKIAQCSLIPSENFYFAVHEEELVAAGRRHGVQVFQRSNVSAAGEDLLEVYEWHDKLPHEFVIKINACSPFLSVDTIDSFIRTYLEGDADGLFSVIRRQDYYWDARGVMVTPWPADLSIMNTKRVAPTFQAAHCLYAGRRARIAEGVWMGSFQQPGDPALFEVDEFEAFDIDHRWQFRMAEALYARTAGGKRVDPDGPIPDGALAEALP